MTELTRESLEKAMIELRKEQLRKEQLQHALYLSGRPVPKDPIINKNIDECRYCNGPLIDTGLQKLLSPPLQVVHCETCDLNYWRTTE